MIEESIEETHEVRLQFAKRGGLLPVVVQDHASGTILMQGYTNEAAFQETLEKRLATFWSTSRNALWTKGETSGDYLTIKTILVDCDQDALIYQVEVMGHGVCHTHDQKGHTRYSCFYRQLDPNQHTLKDIS